MFIRIEEDKRAESAAWLVIGLFFVFRIAYAGMLPLVPDETNYWQWSRHLAWGYHDQAPMIAWAIWLTTSLFGQTELGVRLPSIIAMTVASAYLVLIARRWFTGRTAFRTVLLSQSVLLFNVGSLLATSDGLQGAAWAAAAYHTARAFEDGSWRQWLTGGLWFGFGMLSKYTMVLFLPCVLAFALISPQHRKAMQSIKPYAACALGSLMFLPVICWNASHHWNSVRHVAYIGGAEEKVLFSFKYFGDYLASQAALISPLVFILVCSSWWRVIRGDYPRERWVASFLFWTSLPVAAGFGLLSLHSRVYGNWPGEAYVTAMLLVVFFQFEASPAAAEAASPKHRFWRWTLISSYLISALVLTQAVFPILPLPNRLDRTAHEAHGWDKLGLRVGAVTSGMPRPDHTFIFGLSYQLASELAFYVPGRPYTVSINRWNRPNVYDYWWHDSDLAGMDGVGVTSDANSRKQLLEVFQSVEAPEVFKIFRPNIWQDEHAPLEPVKTLYVYRCFGFKGGLRWIPPDKGDIRVH